ncbi:hypothetical protein BSLG_000023 [Batrachochytrium salamandrivorans]|nr:hypothetical protein BSLG_000023 [Batrachochytrium salamandrivorans]
MSVIACVYLISYLIFIHNQPGSLDGSENSNSTWVEWFLSLRGNEFFCEVDEEYILDRFNLAGLNTEVKYYHQAFELVTDSLEEELDTATWDEVEKSARHLYGLVHARFITTSRGLSKMFEKFKATEFGRCPRVLCHNQAVLPIGLVDTCGSKGVKLYCPRCEDMFPNISPSKTSERYVPRIFGFKVHRVAIEQRKQDQFRDDAARKLQQFEE